MDRFDINSMYGGSSNNTSSSNTGSSSSNTGSSSSNTGSSSSKNTVSYYSPGKQVSQNDPSITTMFKENRLLQKELKDVKDKLDKQMRINASLQKQLRQ